MKVQFSTVPISRSFPGIRLQKVAIFRSFWGEWVDTSSCKSLLKTIQIQTKQIPILKETGKKETNNITYIKNIINIKIYSQRRTEYIL